MHTIAGSLHHVDCDDSMTRASLRLTAGLNFVSVPWFIHIRKQKYSIKEAPAAVVSKFDSQYSDSVWLT